MSWTRGAVAKPADGFLVQYAGNVIEPFYGCQAWNDCPDLRRVFIRWCAEFEQANWISLIARALHSREQQLVTCFYAFGVVRAYSVHDEQLSVACTNSPNVI